MIGTRMMTDMEAWKLELYCGNDELYHHGIKGQKWGVRRYQNEDGSLTNAGRKRYGADLDINDKSKENVAQIRLGEARRRLDVAKSNNNGTNNTRIAELKTRERSAKKAVKYAKSVDKGAKRVAKGETIMGNKAKSYMVGLGASAAAYAASKYVAGYMNSRLADLWVQGKYTPQHRAVAQLITTAAPYTISALSFAYSVKKASDNINIRNYYNSRATGEGSTKAIGSEEYKSVVERSKNKE